MTEQQACTLCGAGGHTAAQCHWNSPGALESIQLPKHGTTIALEEMLAGYLPDDREYIRDVIEAYADIQARKAVMLYSGAGLAGRQSDACDWLENLEGDAWADACEEIAASVRQQAESPQGERIIQTAPERIYLIVGTECPRDVDFSELTEVSWCENDIDDGIEYVRADKAGAAPAAQAGQEPLKLSDDVREFLQEGINSVIGGEDADVDYEFANQLGKLLDPIYAAPVVPVAQAGQVPKELREAVEWADHLLFECGALVQTRAPSVHVYNKAFAAIEAAKTLLAGAPAKGGE